MTALVIVAALRGRLALIDPALTPVRTCGCTVTVTTGELAFDVSAIAADGAGASAMMLAAPVGSVCAVAGVTAVARLAAVAPVLAVALVPAVALVFAVRRVAAVDFVFLVDRVRLAMRYVLLCIVTSYGSVHRF